MFKHFTMYVQTFFVVCLNIFENVQTYFENVQTYKIAFWSMFKHSWKMFRHFSKNVWTFGKMFKHFSKNVWTFVKNVWTFNEKFGAKVEFCQVNKETAKRLTKLVQTCMWVWFSSQSWTVFHIVQIFKKLPCNTMQVILFSACRHFLCGLFDALCKSFVKRCESYILLYKSHVFSRQKLETWRTFVFLVHKQ